MPAVVPRSSSSARRAGSRPPITHVSRRAPASTAARCSSTPPARSAASSATLSRPIGSPRAGQLAYSPSASLSNTSRPAPARSATHAAIESEVTSQDAGSSSKGSAAGRSTVVRRARTWARSEHSTAPGIRSPSTQPNCSMPRIAMWCEVAGRSRKRRSASRTASANVAPPGTTISGWRSPSSPSALHSPGSALSPRPPPTLTTVSTAAPPRAPRAPRRSSPTAPGRRTVPDAPRPRGPGRRRRRPRRPVHRRSTRRAASSICRTCSPWRKAAIASISSPASWSTSEHASLAMRSRAKAISAGRPSGVGQSYASGARWPRTRWTSALMAKYSDATGHQSPRIGTRGAIAARFVRSTPV